ncbi:MAG: tetratricopeptide repeat protein [Urechidicola sp.]|nr:tetratricopeptide repeat protein [Urechidicola sp.]
MKKIVLIAFILFTSIGFSQTAAALFSNANELYQQEKYEAAIEQYELIEELQLQSDELFFNLGNAYYKLNKVAPAIYYFEKSLKLNPSNADTKTNLEFANRMTIDAIEELPKTIFQDFSEAIIYKLQYETWAKMAVAFSFSGAIIFLLYHFSYSSRKKLLYFNVSILGGFLFVVSLAFAFKAYDYQVNRTEAIIFKQTTEIKNAPTLNSGTVFKLHEGTKVEILDEIDDWKKIKLADGKIGWLIADYMKEI